MFMVAHVRCMSRPSQPNPRGVLVNGTAYEVLHYAVLSTVLIRFKFPFVNAFSCFSVRVTSLVSDVQKTPVKL